MRKNILFILYALFLIATIIMFLIVYNCIGGNLALPFVMGYLVLILFYAIYMFSMTIVNLKKLKWVEIKKSIFKFITLFVSFGVLNYGFDYFVRHSNIDLLREFSTSLGIAFAFSFADIAFSKKDSTESKKLLKFKKIKS